MTNIRMTKNKRHILSLLLLSNLFPLFGVLREGWPFFIVLFVFWVEMVIITGFSLLKMFVAQAGDTGWDKIRTMFNYALVRGGIFCFYLIFIVVFIGVMGSSSEQMIRIFRASSFRDPFFNIAILNFAAYNLLEFLFFYMLNKRYVRSTPAEHYIIVDGRQIVVHVVVVLGAFLSDLILKQTGNNFYYSNLALVVLFIFVKSVADYVSLRNAPDEESPESYI